MVKFSELTLAEYMSLLAAGTPIPGGGGAAALAGALGAALASMTANFTVGREKFAENEDEARELLQIMDSARVRLLCLVDEDARAFSKLIESYKLPKTCVEEVATRAEAIRHAAKESAEVPMEVSRLMVDVLGAASKLLTIGNPSVLSDAACSVLFARAAMRCAVYNVRINLELTKDPVYIRERYDELKLLEDDADRYEKEAMGVADKLLGK